MTIDLSLLTTEKRNENSKNLDRMSTEEVLKTINNEDKKVATAVEKVLPNVSIAINQIADALKKGGRLFYVGAGTSGRLGVLDASECPPTFQTSPDLVQTVMAGGTAAFTNARENTEDHEHQGEEDLKRKKLTENDVVIGITASGRTPYPIGALKYAARMGAYTVSLSCNPDSLISQYAECNIEVIVGPEVLTGSTRLKSATAHKMILNMISTTTMIQLGKVYENLMVDVHASNFKLKERAKRIIMEVTEANYEVAADILNKANGEVKPAIVMLEAEVNYDQAKEALAHENGHIREAIQCAKS